MSVVIETTLGDITVDLFVEERPVACLNFLKLCQLKYYNFNLFHTVEEGFIAQTGDPTGSGDGGSSVWGVLEGPTKRFFEAEYLPKIHHTSAGLLSLVSAGKNLVGSQFFFTLGANLTSLDGVHCVIGEIVEGHETLRLLSKAIVDENHRPYQDIRITHTVILDDPFPNPRGFRAPSRSPSPTPERLKNGRIAADEDIDDTDGKTMEEIQEMLAEKEAKARATILEIVGDLPDADMAPPENVLFVCKLNPVTTDDDLEIIFSRFGKVKNCEVIRDKKTGDSLQYAFVEFEEQKSCEAAYFKMDNVLIDDRRIHVDFSQSVAKVKWMGKGRGVRGQEGRLDFNNLKEGGRKDNRNGKYEERRRDNRYNPARLNSEERRRAREERHREREAAQRRPSRSRSRSKGRDRNDRYEERRVRRNDRPPPYDDKRTDRHRTERRRSKSRERFPNRSRERECDRKYNERKRHRSRTRSRDKELQSRRNGRPRSTERDRGGRDGHVRYKEERIERHSPQRKRVPPEDVSPRKSSKKSSRKNKKQKQRLKSKKGKKKKSKRKESSSEESSSGESSEDESSSSSGSSSESASSSSDTSTKKKRKKKK